MLKKRIVVAMSGGVDSSVAACLLKQQGYEVIGITMCFNLTDSIRRKPNCCGPQGIEDARRVAQKIGIKHYVLNMQKVLKQHVIKNFCNEYILGRTPNPCVRCNQYIKFGVLLEKAISLDAKFLATGHYARIITSQSPKRGKVRNHLLKKAKDKNKDQSYFLYRLSQRQLKDVLFPLGDYTKDEVRGLAKHFQLPVADKLASQEICFLPDADYRGFLRRSLKQAVKPGLVLDSQGNILGKHQGIAFHTIGQREGLGIARGYPLYITRIDYKKNLIIAGRKEEAFKKEFLLKDIHFINETVNPVRDRLNGVKKKVAVRVRIRYNHTEERAEIWPVKDRLRVKFRQPQFAITPGQSAVLYDKDIVLGGGIIEEVLG